MANNPIPVTSRAPEVTAPAVMTWRRGPGCFCGAGTTGVGGGGATTLSELRPGQRVNLEADVLAKYVERLLAR